VTRLGRSGRVALVLLALVGPGCARSIQVIESAPPPPRATRDDVVVLLPSRDGRPGSLTVTHGDQQRTLDQPGDAARVRVPGRLETSTVAPDEVQRLFGSTLAALPAPPATFTLYFVAGTDEFTPESQQVVQHIFAEIARRPAPDVLVIGHTDRMGTLEFNDTLSLQRALRVKAELIRQGVAADRIEAFGRGEREPAVPTEDEVAEPRNRRVEINVR
jgi:outer membrane protein OmpA-like peptidoglycan-associated protein